MDVAPEALKNFCDMFLVEARQQVRKKKTAPQKLGVRKKRVRGRELIVSKKEKKQKTAKKS